MGGFGSLAQRPRRDHPFKTSTEPEPPRVIDVQPRVAPEAQPKAVKEKAEKEPSPEVREEKVVPMEARRPAVSDDEEDELDTRPAAGRQAKKKQGKGQGGRKADLFSERITLQLSPKMRDKADSMAKELQRLRTSKDERITANTVMRVAVKLVLERFKPGVGETVANNEEELFQLVKKQICGE